VKNIPDNGADPKTNWPNKTIRQFVWPTFSGNEVRIRLNNEKGESALDIQKVHIAKAKTSNDPGNSGGQIDTTTDVAFTFGGMPNVSIPAGMAVWSDPVDFALEEVKLTAITMQLGATVPTGATGHPGARTTTYFATGDAVATEALTGATTIDRWYFIETLEVMAPKDAYAIAAFGDSITDGYGIINKFERWPDYLTLRIKADPELGPKRSVVNFGMGANNLTKDSTDESNAQIVTQDSGLKRFDHDVITSSKIKWVVVLEGVNDLSYNDDVDGSDLNAAYSSMVTKAHDKGILAYGATILPCTDKSCPMQRLVANNWIKTSGEFDAALDFAGVVSSSENTWNTTYQNDALHPNSVGYKALADSIDLALFENVMQ
jgi:lysophospholipase L1-like esterase